jgi:hypothetical protein
LVEDAGDAVAAELLTRFATGEFVAEVDVFCDAAKLIDGNAFIAGDVIFLSAVWSREVARFTFLRAPDGGAFGSTIVFVPSDSGMLSGLRS